MTTYVVGDIQGCFKPFKKLLKRVDFDPERDRLWAVGDLVNRGKDNLGTLRWFYQHRDCVQVVLGNHDLHLLASRAGAGRMSKSDNIDDILNAPDGGEMMDWLQSQPLLHREQDWVMVHAGIPPNWTLERAEAYATEVSDALKSERAGAFFQTLYGNEPRRWSDHITGLARLRVITNYLTRMRYCTESGFLDLKSKGPKPDKAVVEHGRLAPWFQHPNQLFESTRVLFGHWASLECKTQSEQFVALDSGCVWGGALTFYALETGERITCSCSKKTSGK